MVTYLKQRKRAFKFDIYLRWAISEYGERNLLKNEALEAKRIPGWHIAKKSLFKCFQIDCIKLVFAIEWFEWALNKFTKNEHGRAFLHNLQDMIMVFPKATQYLKDDLTLGDGFTNVVHHCKEVITTNIFYASPHPLMNWLSKPKQGTRFNMVLIKNNPLLEGFLYGLHESYLGRLMPWPKLPIMGEPQAAHTRSHDREDDVNLADDDWVTKIQRAVTFQVLSGFHQSRSLDGEQDGVMD
ncbi:hypothetical protein RhiTH_010510 [Rhizoctonia solani]